MTLQHLDSSYWCSSILCEPIPQSTVSSIEVMEFPIVYTPHGSVPFPKQENTIDNKPLQLGLFDYLNEVSVDHKIGEIDVKIIKDMINKIVLNEKNKTKIQKNQNNLAKISGNVNGSYFSYDIDDKTLSITKNHIEKNFFQ